MSNKALYAFNVFIHDFPQTSAANRQVIPKWNFRNMVCKENLQLVQRSERCHVRTKNSQKVQQDIRHDPGERQPAIIHDHPHIQLIQVRENTDNRADHKIDRYVRDERSNGRQ